MNKIEPVSLRFHSQLVEQSPIVYLIADKDGKIEFVNQVFIKETGYTFEEVIGKKPNILKSGEHSDEFYKHLWKTITSGNVWHGEFHNKKKNGELFWWRSAIYPSKNDKGEITNYIQYSIDFSQGKKADDKLRKLTQAVTQSPSTVAITDLDGNLEYVNPKFEELTGYKLEEVVGKNPRILKSDYHSVAVYKELWKTISSGKIWRGEFHNKKKNGDLYWESSSISPILDDEGKITHYVKVAEDITKRKEVEQALRESEAALRKEQEFMQTLFDHSDDTITVFDPNTQQMIRWNKAINRITGYSDEEIQSRGVLAFYDPKEFKKIAEKPLTKLLQGETEAALIEIPLIRKDKTRVFMGFKVSAIRDLDGKPKYFVGVGRDITQRKQMEEQLKKHTEQLEELVEQKIAQEKEIMRESALKIHGVVPGQCFLSDSFEKCIKAYTNLTVHGFHGLCIARDDPTHLIKEYGLKKEEIRFISNVPFEDFKIVKNLQDISLEISQHVKQKQSIILLNGIEYLIHRFTFDSVFQMLQEKRVQFLQSKSILLIPFNKGALEPKEQSLLETELKTI